MRWEDREESQNVEDRRGAGGGSRVALGGLGSVVVLVVGLALGVDPRVLFRLLEPEIRASRPAAHRAPDAREDKQASFTKVILHDTEVVWDDLFRRMGRGYHKPVLVLFRDAVQSACGHQGAATGPFYCPPDQRVYIDVSFYDDMARQLNAPGDFARAYVIAHEVGHHVQHLLGYSEEARGGSRRGSRKDANHASVRLELQADYLAGVWSHHGQKRYRFLEPGDLERALGAANAIGDDRLQRRSGRRVVPDSFTHGTSRQRTGAFRAGHETGDVAGARRFLDAEYSEL